MNIYVVFHKAGEYEEVTLVTTNVNKVISMAMQLDIPYKVEVWRDGEYIGRVGQSLFNRPIKELKAILLKGGV
jgi:hypothetical protein